MTPLNNKVRFNDETNIDYILTVHFKLNSKENFDD